MKNLNIFPKLFVFPVPEKEKKLHRRRHTDPAQTDIYSLRDQTSKEINDEEKADAIQPSVLHSR